MDRIIHRIPPYVLGPEMYLANDGTDRQPWSIIAHGIPAEWAETMGEGVTVAILDTGLWRHSDLPDPVFAANFSSAASVYDRQGHGTHVAGTIGARLDGAGVVGWAPNCQLGCVKVLGDDGSGDDAGIAKGIRYAVAQGAHVINMSLGGGFSQTIANACAEAIKAGVFVICAAGNEGEGGENTVGYPAKLKDTIAIASYRKDGQISEFSSRGPEVDIAFPGEDILSCWLNGTFRTISGTSMATPAACGLVALMLSYQKKAAARGLLVPSMKSNADLMAHFARHARDMGKPGQDTAFGVGIADAHGVITGDISTTPPVVPPPVVPPVPPPVAAGQLVWEPYTRDGQAGLFVYYRP